jgi:hypothetical protein
VDATKTGAASVAEEGGGAPSLSVPVLARFLSREDIAFGYNLSQ